MRFRDGRLGSFSAVQVLPSAQGSPFSSVSLTVLPSVSHFDNNQTDGSPGMLSSSPLDKMHRKDAILIKALNRMTW